MAGHKPADRKIFQPSGGKDDPGRWDRTAARPCRVHVEQQAEVSGLRLGTGHRVGTPTSAPSRPRLSHCAGLRRHLSFPP
jgi:hypothetical protein